MRSAPGGARSQRPLERSVASASQLPSLSGTASNFNTRPHALGKGRNGSVSGLGQQKPPLSSLANSRPPRVGNYLAKEDKDNAIITVDDLQRLRE